MRLTVMMALFLGQFVAADEYQSEDVNWTASETLCKDYDWQPASERLQKYAGIEKYKVCKQSDSPVRFKYSIYVYITKGCCKTFTGTDYAFMDSAGDSYKLSCHAYHRDGDVVDYNSNEPDIVQVLFKNLSDKCPN